MARKIRAARCLRIDQIGAAINQTQAGFGRQFSKGGRVDQGGKCHESSLAR
jgi:predicted secreted Zn-dependent protease